MANDPLEHEDTLDRECVHFPMRVQPLATRALSAAGLLNLAKERAQDESVFEERPPFFFTGAVSTTLLDSYSTRMDPSSLTNFATDMETGVSLQDSHNTFKLGLGASLTGRMVRGKGEKPTRTEGEFYMLSGGEVQETIEKIRAGIVRDMSVGFYGGRWVCDVCGGDMRNWRECPHWPGVETTPEGADAPVTVTATIHEARLSEVSLVYDGATPGAGILKAIRAAESGELEPEKVRCLEAHYRVHLPAPRQLWPAVTAGPIHLPSGFIISPSIPTWTASSTDARSLVLDTHGKEPTVADEKTRAPEPSGDLATLQGFHRMIYGALTDAGCEVTDGSSPATLIRTLGAERVEVVTLRDKVAEQETRIADLEPRAKDGDAYRTDLVDQTWGEFVRAGLSDGELEEESKEAWRLLSLPKLKKELARYTKLGDDRLGGGRVTTEGGPDPARVNGFITPAAPASAFRA